MLTEEAIYHIGKARRIFGSSRAVEIVRPRIPAHADVTIINDFSRLTELPKDAVVLSTGDPMLAGLGHAGSEVVPGISSMQLAFSRLRLPLTKGIVVDAHGRRNSGSSVEALDELERGRIPFLLTDPNFDIDSLAKMMLARNLDAKIALCERLGYPNEIISFGRPSCPPRSTSDLMVIVLFEDKIP
jgi:cobalt-precorrin-7 (C5)-methyltransferase